MNPTHTPTPLEQFLKAIPASLYGACCDAKDIDEAKHMLLLEMDFFTDEPASERSSCAIKTKKQYEKAKAIYGGHPR